MRRSAALLLVTLSASMAASQQLPFDQVAARLKAPDPAARLSALGLLVESGYPEAAGPIAPLLNDPDDRVQRAATYAELSLLLGVPVKPTRHVGLVVEMRNDQPARAAFEAGWSSLPIAPVPVAVVTGLLAPTAHKDPAFRVEALYALGVLAQIDDVVPPPAYERVGATLAERLADPEPAGRAAAARAAGRVFRRCPQPCSVAGLDRLGDALVHTLNDPEPGVRAAAMGALGDLRWERAVASLASLYDYYKKGDDASAALFALARIGHPSSMPVFQSALGKNDDRFLVAAVEGLGRCRSREVAGLDAALGGQQSAAVRLAVTFAQHRAGLADRTDLLIAALDARATREQAQDYLVELGHAVVPAIVAAMRSATFPSLAPRTRVALIEIVSAVGSRDAAAAIEPFETDKNQAVATSAAHAVARLQARR